MISTRDLNRLPKPEELRCLLQTLALLDAILEEDWEHRYYSFNEKWSDTEQMGSMRNGSGDDFFAVFSSAGCFLRGFDHESAMTPWSQTPPRVWPGVLDGVPAEFESSLKEPAFHMEDTTFCIWWPAVGSTWSHGLIEFPKGEEDPDGSQWMLSALDGDPRTYQVFAKEYFESDVALTAISRIYAHEPLSRGLLLDFPSSRSFEDVAADAEEIGYPIAR